MTWLKRLWRRFFLPEEVNPDTYTTNEGGDRRVVCAKTRQLRRSIERDWRWSEWCRRTALVHNGYFIPRRLRRELAFRPMRGRKGVHELAS